MFCAGKTSTHWFLFKNKSLRSQVFMWESRAGPDALYPAWGYWALPEAWGQLDCLCQAAYSQQKQALGKLLLHLSLPSSWLSQSLPTPLASDPWRLLGILPSLCLVALLADLGPPSSGLWRHWLNSSLDLSAPTPLRSSTPGPSPYSGQLIIRPAKVETMSVLSTAVSPGPDT